MVPRGVDKSTHGNPRKVMIPGFVFTGVYSRYYQDSAPSDVRFQNRIEVISPSLNFSKTIPGLQWTVNLTT